jgi:glycine/D-amino acid oxidase-like deaminating enzyme
MNIDFLIVGQGLAGSLLAWQLLQRGCKVWVIDNGLESASQVAAGLINPITGMRLVKAFQVDEFLPIAKQCYAQLAQVFQQTFYVEQPMLRIFNSNKELDNARKRLTDTAYQLYLSELQTAVDSMVMPYQAIWQKQTGYLATRPLLAALKQFFIEQACYQQAEFDVAELQLQPLQWRGVSIKRVIFCEGHAARHNPYFDWLPFQVVKGEILTLQHNQTLPDAIVNYGHWLIPTTTDMVRIGATFDWQTLDTQTSETAKQALLASVFKILPNFHYHNIEQHAQIRPCTLDKQPFIGFHPKHPQLAIFNGFGAKGSLQIPYHAKLYTEVLLNKTTLPIYCDIRRYVTD